MKTGVGIRDVTKPSVLAVALTRNVCYRFMYLNICDLLAGHFENIMDHLGGRALLEEVCHCGWALRFYSLAPLPVFFLGFLCAEDTVKPASCSGCHAMLARPPYHDRLHPFWSCN